MSEKEWVNSIVKGIENSLRVFDDKLRVGVAVKLPYSSEILSYENQEPKEQNFIRYETDILIYEQTGNKLWKPRIIIEAKINNVNTHAAIAYSQKAQTHKNVHPYLRYGILIGNRKHHPLPGRLFRHGQHFDFMQSWKSYKADKNEWNSLIEILKLEYKASLALEEIIFNSRIKSRKKFTILHKPLKLDKD